jgi:hypothetical protein
VVGGEAGEDLEEVVECAGVSPWPSVKPEGNVHMC